MMYSLDYVFNTYIPTRVKTQWPKYRKHYGGERDDLCQAARMAVWDNVKDKSDEEREKLTGFEDTVDKAIVAEVKSTPRASINWLEWPMEEREDGLAWAVEVLDPESEPIDREQLKKLTNIRDQVRVIINNKQVEFMLWMQYGVGWSSAEIAKELTQRVSDWDGKPITAVEVEYQLRLAGVKIRENLTDARETMKALSNFQNTKRRKLND